jgi:hypothetical protein
MQLLAIIAGPEVGLGKHALFGAGGESSVHPAVIAATIVAVLLMFALPRKHVLAPLLFLTLLTPPGQRIMVGTLHFQIFRILVIFAWMRLLALRYGSEGPSSRIKINSVDKAVIFYSISCIVCYTLLWQDSAAFFDEVGKAYSALGFYFVFRFFIRDQKDVERAIVTLAVTASFIAPIMLNEQITGRNVLAIFGGVPEFTAVREGYLRSQGPFSVFLTAGAFGATLIPLFLCLWHKGGSRLFATLGIVAALTITITSRTSTAISACLASAIGLGMWAFRDKMSLVRRGLVMIVIGLHLVMKAPVWSLIARIDIVGGSTGWHRFKIIDNFVKHFWDWWLLGSNNYWNWEGGDDMWDTANQYVSTGETTGLLSLIFFLAAVVFCFKYLGKARKAAGSNSGQAWFFWLLGVALFSNLVAFFGICYFDQTMIYWYLLLAMIVAATASARKYPAAERLVTPIISKPPLALGSPNVESARPGSMLLS